MRPKIAELIGEFPAKKIALEPRTLDTKDFGKYTRENLKEEDNRLSDFDFLPTDKELGFKVVDRMREIAEGHTASVAQVALAWLLSKPVVSSIIVGASKLHQLEDNLQAVNVKLSASEVEELDSMTAPTVQYSAQ